MNPLTLPIAADSVLAVIDIQERLAQAMDSRWVQGNLRRSAKLVMAARKLGMPVLLSEQYPKGLGRTLPVIAAQLAPETKAIEKTEFSCWGNPEWRAALCATGRGNVILVGMEAHVCVLQTAGDLVGAGLRPWVVADAVCSRSPVDFRGAMRWYTQCGIPTPTFEMLLFGWLQRAGTPQFKELSGLARDKDE